MLHNSIPISPLLLSFSSSLVREQPVLGLETPDAGIGMVQLEPDGADDEGEADCHGCYFSGVFQCILNVKGVSVHFFDSCQNFDRSLICSERSSSDMPNM